ncbi:MAG: hypothetical protein IT461_01660 [Planctomycetes bacterium]|nr:hypothetical protein [Planctomycetota bacterium]
MKMKWIPVGILSMLGLAALACFFAWSGTWSETHSAGRRVDDTMDAARTGLNPATNRTPSSGDNSRDTHQSGAPENRGTPASEPVETPEPADQDSPAVVARGRPSQEGFTFEPDRPLVLRPDVDEHEGIMPIARVKDAYGFDQWTRTEGVLCSGLKFDVSVLGEFEVRQDKCVACFSGPEEIHGVRRSIELRRGSDTVSIVIVVALSARAAQEQFIPVVRIENEPQFHVPPGMINSIALGDVNTIGRFPGGEAQSVAFSRNNVYFSIVAKRLPSSPIPEVDPLRIAQEVESVLGLEQALTVFEFEALRPQITRFALSQKSVDSGSPKTDSCAVEYRVRSKRNAKLFVLADGTGDLQYDDRSNPSRMRALEPGSQTARLIVIDDYLLFTWADQDIEVR